MLTFLFSHSVSAATENIVTKVINVNTLEINSKYKIKLYGISSNIYEEYQKFKEKHDMRPFDINYNTVGELEQYTIEGNTYVEDDAIKAMQKLLLNKNVHIEAVENNKYIVFFSQKDNFSINQLIIANGFASVDENINSNYRMKFLLAEKNAKDNNLGIWNISFKSVSSGSSETTLPNVIYIILSVFIFINLGILIFSIIKLSSLPSWKGLFYGLFSLMLIPFPSIIISFQYELVSKIFLFFNLALIRIYFLLSNNIYNKT